MVIGFQISICRVEISAAVVLSCYVENSLSRIRVYGELLKSRVSNVTTSGPWKHASYTSSQEVDDSGPDSASYMDRDTSDGVLANSP